MSQENQEQKPLPPEKVIELMEDMMKIPAVKKMMFAKARQDRDFVQGGKYYNEEHANNFVKPIADHMLKYKGDLKILFSDYDGIMSPNTLYAKIMQGSKYLADVGGEQYDLWRSLIKIQRRTDHIIFRFIKDLKDVSDVKPIFHPVEKEEKQNEWKDLYDWLELDVEPADKESKEFKDYKLYLRQKLELSTEDIHSLNNLFKEMPQFTARIKHDEIKVIREKIEDANINA